MSAVLSVTKVEACTLLCHYKWNVSQLHDEWFVDEEKVRKTVGLPSGPVVSFPDAEELTCGICFDDCLPDETRSGVCGHPYCVTCWKGYITAAINDGPGCLLLRCPEPSCRAVVGQDVIHELASEEEKEKFSRYFFRSYIEDKRKTKWCPAPGCDNAVEYEIGSNIYDVTCLCSHVFCWNCCEDIHRPVDCDTVAKWMLKNSAESENMTWIIANSKPCPKCKRAIEKNMGCMHMTCTAPCRFEFCWLCLGDWSEHNDKTGGFYSCNRYEAAKEDKEFVEEERKREQAKNYLEKYTHYYERWAGNQKSRDKAIADLREMQAVHLEKLGNNVKEPVSQLKFIIEAWQQIIECRRVLKWTYAYGYYLPEREHGKRQLFEYLQGEAEAGLERLHQCAEKELNDFLDEEEPKADFIAFRQKLAGLTGVTRTYFENLVRALENNLSDVAGGTSTSPRVQGKGKGSSPRSGQSSRGLDHIDRWLCQQCTFANPETSTVCEMCFLDRSQPSDPPPPENTSGPSDPPPLEDTHEQTDPLPFENTYGPSDFTPSPASASGPSDPRNPEHT